MGAPDDYAPVYYRVSPAIWRQRWSEQARYLALYLLTCTHRNVEGYFVLPKPYICGDMKWTAEQLAEPFAELLDDGFFMYEEDAEVCLIVKALDYQPPANDNVRKAAIKRVKCVPKNDLDAEFYASAKRFAKPFAEQLRERLPERFGKPLLCSTLLNSTACASASDGSAPLAHAEGMGEMYSVKDLAAAVLKKAVTA